MRRQAIPLYEQRHERLLFALTVIVQTVAFLAIMAGALLLLLVAWALMAPDTATLHIGIVG